MNNSLFDLWEHTLASKQKSLWKIDCDYLIDKDWETFAFLASKLLPSFGSVEGVPTGGLIFAEKLKLYITEGPLLICDDVLTTGGSMEKLKGNRTAMGIVAFSRGKCPEWIIPIWILNQ